MIDNYYNEDAEKSLLGIMLVDSSKVSSISYLVDVSDFYKASHRILYPTTIQPNQCDQTTDSVPVSHQLQVARN